jgi:hypothetical protein
MKTKDLVKYSRVGTKRVAGSAELFCRSTAQPRMAAKTCNREQVYITGSSPLIPWIVVSLKRPPSNRFSMNQWLNESMSQCLNLVSPILVM